MDFEYTPPVDEVTREDELLSMIESQLEANGHRATKAPTSKLQEAWTPKEWKVEYEIIVLMHLHGKSGVEIATITEYTPQHIYNILATPQAIAIENALLGKIRKEAISVTDEIQRIQKLTVKRLRESLEDDNKFNSAPLGFISKGIEVMKGTGEHIRTAPNTEIKNTFVIPASVATRFIEGLEKSDQARALLNAGSVSDGNASTESNQNIEEAELVEDDAA